MSVDKQRIEERVDKKYSLDFSIDDGGAYV